MGEEDGIQEEREEGVMRKKEVGRREWFPFVCEGRGKGACLTEGVRGEGEGSPFEHGEGGELV